MNWTAIVSVLLALAAGGFAWERHQAADAAQAQMDSLKTAADQARADLVAARSERESLLQQTTELRQVIEDLRGDLDAQRKFLEAERADTVRLQQELAAAKSRLEAVNARAGRSGTASPGQAATR